jgi:hypothetical protein
MAATTGSPFGAPANMGGLAAAVGGGSSAPTGAGPQIDLSGLGSAVANFPSEHPMAFGMNLGSIGIGAIGGGLVGGPIGALAGAVLGAGKAIVGDFITAGLGSLANSLGMTGLADFLGYGDLHPGPATSGVTAQDLPDLTPSSVDMSAGSSGLGGGLSGGGAGGVVGAGGPSGSGGGGLGAGDLSGAAGLGGAGTQA